MSFNKEDYNFKEEYEGEVVNLIEKTGELLTTIDLLVSEMDYYRLLTKWPDGSESVSYALTLFQKIGGEYSNWRDHILHRLSKGDKIVKLKEELIEKLKTLEVPG